MSMNIGGCIQAAQCQQSQQGQKSGGLNDLMQALFNQADGDGDGSINLSEFTSLMGQTGAGTGASGATSSAAGNTSDLFKSIDKDGDGQISMDEFKKFASGGLFSSQVDAAAGKGSGLSGMLDKVVHAAEDLFESVFGDASGLPPGTTVSATVQATLFENGGYFVSASVSETHTNTLTEADSGKVVASASVTHSAQLANALSIYDRHKHHGMNAAELFGKADSNSDGSLSGSEFASLLNVGTSAA